jgi:hypothetical protein
VYVRWSKMVVVVDCDGNFIATMVFINSFVTSLGRKRMHVLQFLLIAKNPFLHSWTLIHCNMFMHGSTFDIPHHVKVPKAIIY